MLILDRKTDDLAHNLITYIKNCIAKGPCICCGFTNAALDQHCNVLQEIGVIFLTDTSDMERAIAEEFCVSILQGSEFPPSFKRIALYFLRHKKAAPHARSKRIIAAFEEDLQNREIVQGAKKRLMQD